MADSVKPSLKRSNSHNNSTGKRSLVFEDRIKKIVDETVKGDGGEKSPASQTFPQDSKQKEKQKQKKMMKEQQQENGKNGQQQQQNQQTEKQGPQSSLSASRKGTLARKHTLWQLYEDDKENHFSSIGHYLKSFKGSSTDEMDEEKKVKTQEEKLGTILGVYLPSIQNVLGIQMFLRLLWIVGMSGVVESFSMVAICCLCTFLTSISIAAIATNGVIEGGGAYYMISRSLGPEVGGAIGILYYLANACAAGMYLAGGVELLLLYMAPNLPRFGDPKEYNEADMFNNFRVYGTLFVIIEFVICVIGMKLIQIVGPFSLGCVILAIISVFAGGIAANSDSSEKVCLVGQRLLKPSTYMINGTAYCDKNQSHPIWSHFCATYNETNVICDPYFLKHDVEYVPAIPGFSSGSLFSNAWSNYMEHGETVPDLLGNPSVEVVQDLTTSFFVLLGILFPTFTDIICGANLSGDLKDPQTSLAIGVVAAQLSTSFVYLSFVLIYGGCVVGEVLRDKYGRSIGDSMIVAKLAWPHEWVLLVGCFTSTFGAALQCLYSAPKILHAIAKDDVLPFLSVFQKVTKRNREPVRALILTALLTEAVILIGGIDYIAPVCNCFFLMCYGAVNIVCGLQTLLKAPNWRPRFKIYHWSLSLLGALLCLFFMLGSNWYYSIMVILLTGAIYKYIEYKGAKKEWGDGIRGLALSTAQYSLLKAEENRMNAQNWRPQLLVLLKLEAGEENMNRKMLLFANQLKAGRGLTMAATLIEGNLTNHEDEAKSQQIRDKLQEQMKEAKLKGFTEVVLVPDPAENICALIQCVGMGSLRPNTVIVGWPNNWKNRLQKRNSKYWDFLDTVHRVATNHMCLLVPKGLFMYPEPLDQLAGTIDIWWIIHDGGLMILLPFLLRQHRVWRQCKIRVFTIAQLQDNTVRMKEDLQRWVYQLRIDATVEVVELSDAEITMEAYERTMLMEDRARLSLNLSMGGKKSSVDPVIAQHLRESNNSYVPPATSGGHNQQGTDAGTLFMPETVIQMPDTDEKNRKSSPKKHRKVKIKLNDKTLDSRDYENSHTSRRRHRRRHSFSSSSSSLADSECGSKPGGKRIGSTPGKDNTAFEPDVNDTFDELRSKWLTSGRQLRRSSDMPSKSVRDFAKNRLTEKRNSLFHSHSGAELSDDGSIGGNASRTVDDDKRIAREERFSKLDVNKLRKMHTALKMNRLIKEKSSTGCRLYVLNLPRPPHSREGLVYYMEYLEALTDGLERVLLVRGSGKEVITIY